MKSDYLKLHLIVVIWGFTGVLGALIDLDAVHIVWHRMLIASAGMFLWMAILGKNLLLGWRGAVKTLGTGVIIALHWISFFHSIKVSNVSVALACMSTVSFFTALLEPLFFKRRIIPYELLFGLLIIAGLYLIFRFEPGYSEGIIFSVISSFLAALFTVINGLLIRER
ncbi:MAG: EamA family transporter, partial [Flavobacteriales bacterium]